jgi:hypothetical protein
MNEAQTIELEPLVEKMVQPDNSQKVRVIVDAFHYKSLADMVRRYFGKGKTEIATKLFRKEYSRVYKEDVISALDRLIVQEPEFIKFLLRPWLRSSQTDIQNLREGKLPNQDTPPEVLSILLWLADSENLVQAVVDQLSKKYGDVYSNLEEEQQKNSQLTEDKTQLGKLLEQRDGHIKNLQGRLDTKERELAETVKRHESELKRRDDAHNKKLQQVTDQYADMFKRHEANSDADKNNLRARFDSDKNEAVAQALTSLRDDLIVEHEAEKGMLQQQMRDHQQILEEARTALQTLESAHQEKLTGLQKEINSQKQNYESELDSLTAEKLQLEQELSELRQPTKPSLSNTGLPDVDTFARLLIFHYERGGGDPIERLLTLFKAYRAFVEEQFDDETLLQVSNIEKFSEAPPEGLMITTVVQLLEDGASISLESFLNLRSLRQESILRQFVRRLESPTFGETP